MNEFQRLWWEQAKSDYEVFALLVREGVAPCHSLHYLQMATEKLAKAYFWRDNSPPPKSHAGFARFLRFVVSQGRDRDRIANLLNFSRFVDLRSWIRAVLPLANDLERLAPALANDGPNAEYPWPYSRPQSVPVEFEFQAWQELRDTWQGRRLQDVVKRAIREFPAYAAT